MTFSKKLLASSVLLALSSTSFAGPLTANASLASDYIWRGASQTDNGFSLQGGIDYDMGNGLTAGAWLATGIPSPADREIDLYANYGGKLDAFDYSVGFIHYNYANGSSNEINAYISKDAFSAGINMDTDTNDSVIDLGYSATISELDVSANYYIPSVSGADNTLQVSVGKSISGFDIAGTLGYDGTDSAFGISATKGFDL